MKRRVLGEARNEMGLVLLGLDVVGGPKRGRWATKGVPVRAVTTDGGIGCDWKEARERAGWCAFRSDW